MSLPPRALSQLQQGLAHHQAGRLEAARALYDQVRRVAPNSFDAVHLAGVLAYQQARYTEAERLLAQALRLNTKSWTAHMRLALVWLAQGKTADALERLRRVVAVPEAPPEAWIHLARALLDQRQAPEAHAAAKTAVRLLNDSVDAHRIFARATVECSGLPAAVPSLARLTELAPKDAQNWSDYGVALAWAGDLPRAFGALQRALELAPTLTHARVGLGFACQQAHRIPEAVDHYSAALTQEPGNSQAASARLLCLHYLDDVSREAVFAAHREFGARAQTASVAAMPPRQRRERLRVAFLSADFRRHSVAYFIAPLLQHLDRSKFEIVLYHDHHQVDGMSDRLKSLAEKWLNFSGWTNTAVEERIRQDSPDILVDLAGHTGFNRLPLFARRLAPVQVTYLGYPDTTGLATMDFRLVDEVTDPTGDADPFHTEQLVRFAPTAWAYEPPVDAPEPAALPAASGGSITFGSFNAFGKISDRTLRVWSRLLGDVPDSRLLLKGHGLDDGNVQRHILERISAAGIPPERVELLGRTPNLRAHLELYERMDIALDPLPYSGTTTTCEALWMGRPVVTLAGDRHASRVSASLLSAIGRSDWIAADEDDYVRIASGLAKDQLPLLRDTLKLRRDMAASPLCDYPGQAARFGAALERCWQRKYAEESAAAARSA